MFHYILSLFLLFNKPSQLKMNKQLYLSSRLFERITSILPFKGYTKVLTLKMNVSFTTLLLFSLVLCHFTTHGQSGSNSPTLAAEWDKTFGGNKPDYLSTMISTSDGGYLLSGYSSSGMNGDRSENSRGGHDYWIVKTNKEGIKQWDKRFGGTSDDILSSVLQSRDGSYLLSGYSASATGGDKTEDSQGELDYWVVKIDSSGNKLWDKRFGGSGTDVLRSAILSPDGGYLLAGNSYSQVSGDKSQDSRGAEDFWIVKIDSSGNKQWDHRYGGVNAEYLSNVLSIGKEGYLLVGTSYSGIEADKSQDSRGGWDYWLVKVDSVGNKQWDKRFGGSRSDFPAQVIQTGDGNYLLAGISDSGIGGDKTQDNRGGWDYWLVKTDTNGSKLWDKRFGGGLNDDLNVLLESKDGNYLLGGSSDSETGSDKTSESKGGNDYWLVKVNNQGVKLWDMAFGGNTDDQLFAVAQTLSGNYLLAGYSSSPISGDKTIDSKGSHDYWLLKTTPDGLLPPMLQVNFGDVNTIPPQGWVNDYGLPFGEKTLPTKAEVWNYGWKKKSDSTPVDLSIGGPFPGNGRWRPAPSDTLLASLMHMQGNDVNQFKGTAVESYWELAVENGRYQVSVSVGDGSVWYLNDEFHSINVEGINIITKFLPTGPAGSSGRFKQASIQVTVTDGLLTIDADGGTNTKINYAIIQPLPESALPSTAENSIDKSTLQTSVYPNPFTDTFTVKTYYQGKVRLALLDMMGNQYYSADHQVENGQLSLDVAALPLPAGIYFIRLQSQEGVTQIYKVIKR